MNGPRYRYRVYGATVASDMKLSLPLHAEGDLAAVELREAGDDTARLCAGVSFESDADDWSQFATPADGSTYACWRGVGEFLVAADGRFVRCRRFGAASHESFEVYMLGQALSFALVKQGLEPLHATVVEIDGRAAAFLGASGMGKSSLAACFLKAGYRVLTDDLLILRERDGEMLAYPGPPRLKLYPEIAARFLGAAAEGVPMNLDTNKLIVRLDSGQVCSHAIPLGAIYNLAEPEDPVADGIKTRILSERESFVALVGHTFNPRLVNPQRLSRQFHAAARLSAAGPVRELSYPRVLERLPEVVSAVVEDVRWFCSCDCAV